MSEHHFEVRRTADQPFLSPERDILVWFLNMCKASFVLTENQMNDLDDEALVKELRFVIGSLKDYRQSIYMEDVESDVIVRRLWDKLSSTRCGRLFLANMAMNVMTMFVNASRRSVEQPTLRIEELEAGMRRDSLLSRLDPELADKVREKLREVPHFGEFVPGLYQQEEVKENDGKEG